MLYDIMLHHIIYHTAGTQKFGLWALKGKRQNPIPLVSSVFFSWHLADEISEFLLTDITCLKRPNNRIHRLPVGKQF